MARESREVGTVQSGREAPHDTRLQHADLGSFQDFLMLMHTFSIHCFTCSFDAAQIINANLISLKSQAEATFRPCCKWEGSKVTLRLEVAMV